MRVVRFGQGLRGESYFLFFFLPFDPAATCCGVDVGPEIASGTIRIVPQYAHLTREPREEDGTISILRQRRLGHIRVTAILCFQTS